MSYDERFRTGFDWLDSDTSEPAHKLVLAAVFAAIYDSHGSPDVTRILLRAYDELRGAEADDAGEELAIVYFEGDAAETFCQKVYLKTAVSLARRAGLLAAEDDQAAAEARLIDSWWWPDSLPTNYPIPRFILRSVANRMACADIEQLRRMQTYYEANRSEIDAADRAATEERTT